MDMLLRDVMTAGVEVVSPDRSILDCAEKMEALDVGVLPVCNGQKIVGMVTDRDIVIKGVAARHDPQTTKVTEIMTSPVIYAFDDQSVEDALKLMESKQVRRLIVVDRNKKLVGIASLGDIAVKAGDSYLTGEALEKVSEPARPMM